MALIVEDGTGVADANAYVTRAYCDSYHEEMGNTTWIAYSNLSPTPASNAAGDNAIVRASRGVDRKYRSRWKGTITNFGEQGLDFPRSGIYIEGNLIEDDEITTDFKHAICEAALIELTTPGSLNPELERGGEVEFLKAGSVEIRYSGGASRVTVYNALDNLLINYIANSDEMVRG